MVNGPVWPSRRIACAERNPARDPPTTTMWSFDRMVGIVTHVACRSVRCHAYDVSSFRHEGIATDDRHHAEHRPPVPHRRRGGLRTRHRLGHRLRPDGPRLRGPPGTRSEEHTSELQSLMRISYAVFCLNKKNHKTH